MTKNIIKTLAWRRKHKNSERIHESTNSILKALIVSMGVLSAFFITLILTLHIELSALMRNILYGDPIIIKRPISMVKNIPIIHKDSLSTSPVIIEVQEEKTVNTNGPTGSPKSSTVESVTQVGSYTFQVRIGSDDRMASPHEILDALNEYRKNKNMESLQWNNALADYALTRAQYFSNNKILDEHEGFRRFVNNEEGFEKLGFDALGENSAYLSGGALMGKNIVEQLFASDIYHDSNQLDSKWTHAGVGVDGLAINIIFGGRKID